MEDISNQIKSLETQMWEAAKLRDTKRFLDLVSTDAIMVCGGYRCTGLEYSHYIAEFDLASYQMEQYETVICTENIVQNHYIITTMVNDKSNSDLEGEFHITSTWEHKNEGWKLVYNMDSRIKYN